MNHASNDKSIPGSRNRINHRIDTTFLTGSTDVMIGSTDVTDVIIGSTDVTDDTDVTILPIFYSMTFAI